MSDTLIILFIFFILFHPILILGVVAFNDRNMCLTCGQKTLSKKKIEYTDRWKMKWIEYKDCSNCGETQIIPPSGPMY